MALVIAMAYAPNAGSRAGSLPQQPGVTPLLLSLPLRAFSIPQARPRTIQAVDGMACVARSLAGNEMATCLAAPLRVLAGLGFSLAF